MYKGRKGRKEERPVNQIILESQGGGGCWALIPGDQRGIGRRRLRPWDRIVVRPRVAVGVRGYTE